MPDEPHNAILSAGRRVSRERWPQKIILADETLAEGMAAAEDTRKAIHQLRKKVG